MPEAEAELTKQFAVSEVAQAAITPVESTTLNVYDEKLAGEPNSHPTFWKTPHRTTLF